MLYVCVVWIEFLFLCDWIEDVEIWCGIGIVVSYLLLVCCVVCGIGVD